MKISSRTAQAETKHTNFQRILEKRFKTSSATELSRFALKISNKKNPEYLLCDDNAKKSQVGASFFLSLMLVIRGFLTFLFPILDLFFYA